MIERATDKVAETAFFEIIVILLVILVALIVISNFLLKKKEYKKYDEDEYISVENFLFIIGWVTLIIFLLIGYFNYFYSGLSIIQLLKFTLIETGIIMILTIFLLFNNGYIGHSHFSGYIFATIIGIFSFASLIASILLAILTNSLPILAAIGLSGITSLSSLINFSGNNPNDENLPQSDGQGRIESPPQPMLEEVAESSPQMLEEVAEGSPQMLEEVAEGSAQMLEEVAEGSAQMLEEVVREKPTDALEDAGVFEDANLIPEDIVLDEPLPPLVNIEHNNQSRIPLPPYMLQQPPGAQIVDIDRIQAYQQNNTIGLSDLITNPIGAISVAASALIQNPSSIVPTRSVMGGSGSKEKQKIIIVMICLILLILDKKK